MTSLTIREPISNTAWLKPLGLLLLAGTLMLCGTPSTSAGNGSPLVGIWRAQFADIQGNPATVELVLQPNGRYSQQTATGFSLLTIVGTYQFFVDQGILRLNIQQYEPREWCGPLGCSPILLPAGETLQFEMRDRDSLLTRTTGCAPGTCAELFYRRVIPY
jgi:hypothetical protein